MKAGLAGPLLVATLLPLTVPEAAEGLRPPSSKLNLRSSLIETADAEWTPSGYEIRHVVSSELDEPPVVTRLTSDPHDDLSPQVVCDAVTGDSWVAWWRDDATDSVLVRKRMFATGAWSPEARLSSLPESSRLPSLAILGGEAWVAFEFDGAGGSTAIAVKPIEDDPAPFLERTVVGVSAAGGARDVQLHTHLGHLWVTWVDDGARVGWSELGPGGWSAAAYETYVADSVHAARGRIRGVVTAN